MPAVQPIAPPVTCRDGARLASPAPASQPITICHPVWRLDRGGTERQLVEIIRRLPRDRFRHLLLVRGAAGVDRISGGDLPQNVHTVCDARTGRDLRWRRRLARLLLQHRVDVLHVRGLAMVNDAAAAAGRAGGVPVVFSFHGLEQPGARLGPWRRWARRAAVQKCAARWAVSHDAAVAVAQVLGMAAEEFAVVPNGVDLDRYAPSPDESSSQDSETPPVGNRCHRGLGTHSKSVARRRLGLPIDAHVVVCVGNLKPVKAHEVLIDAMSAVATSSTRVTLALVGHDYRHDELRQRARRLPAQIDVRFAGRVDDVRPWYHAADVFALPSHYEGLSNALLEAMACGLPVVATAVGGNRDAVEHGVNGLLVPPADAAALAAAIRFLLDDADCRARLGGAARRTVVERFNLSDTVREYAERYEELAQPRRTAASAVDRTEGPIP